MSTLTEPDLSTETMADLLHRLGDIPPSRVRVRPAPGTATEADVVRIHLREKRLFELVDGVLVEKGMGYWDSVIAQAIARALGNWVVPRNLGMVSGEAGMMKFFSSQVRMPDVACASYETNPGLRGQRESVPRIVPDIAVEVLSESNTPKEMDRKREEYFGAGTRLVWIVDPATRSVAVYTTPDQFTTLSGNQSLDGGAVIPGFTLPLSDVFANIE